MPRHIKNRLPAAAAAAAAAVILCLVVLDAVCPLRLEDRPWSTLVLARDGTPLRAFADENGVWRYPTDPASVSPLYIQALLTYEDRWFHYHPGVNPFSFFRALIQNIRAGRIVSGGSTLTMQVARILYPNRRTLAGKMTQVLRAFQLEAHLSKNEILTLYLNYAPFGANIEGVQTASFTWLGKKADRLSHAQAALLAVLPQAPSFYRPDRHPERARAARDKVLDRMAEFGVWSPEQVTAAKQEHVAAFRFHPPMDAPILARRLFSSARGRPLLHTTIDYDLQRHLQDMVMEYVTPLGKHQSGAAMVMNLQTLEVLAYVGSSDFSSKDRNGHVDMIRAVRSPGSALKPFLYGMALDEGIIHSHSLLMDTPRFRKEYDPGNFSRGFSGPVTMTRALRRSLNVPAVQVLEAFGPQTFHDRLVNAGAVLDMSGRPNLSMVLGGLGTRLESILVLYSALARGGLTGMPRLLKSDPVRERYLMSEGAAWIISRILSQPMPGFEGISRLSGRTPMAWKTGTSYGFRDAWAFGIMGEYVAGVWVGRPDGTPCPGQYGAVTAIPLLQRVVDSLPMSDFRKKQPESVTLEPICWPQGTLKSQTKEDCVVTHDAWILDHQVPPTLNPDDAPAATLSHTFWVDASGRRASPSCGGIHTVTRSVWPAAAEPWLPSAWKARNIIPEASPDCPDIAPLTGTRIRITSIFPGSMMSRPPGQTAVPDIPLSALGGSGRQHWFLNGEPVAVIPAGSAGAIALPPPGAYQLAVADETGHVDMVQFTVLSLD